MMSVEAGAGWLVGRRTLAQSYCEGPPPHRHRSWLAASAATPRPTRNFRFRIGADNDPNSNCHGEIRNIGTHISVHAPNSRRCRHHRYSAPEASRISSSSRRGGQDAALFLPCYRGDQSITNPGTELNRCHHHHSSPLWPPNQFSAALSSTVRSCHHIPRVCQP